MNIELEQIKLKFIEAQIIILQYQHRDCIAAITSLSKPQKTEEDKNEQLPDTP